MKKVTTMVMGKKLKLKTKTKSKIGALVVWPSVGRGCLGEGG